MCYLSLTRFHQKEGHQTLILRSSARHGLRAKIVFRQLFWISFIANVQEAVLRVLVHVPDSLRGMGGRNQGSGHGGSTQENSFTSTRCLKFLIKCCKKKLLSCKLQWNITSKIMVLITAVLHIHLIHLCYLLTPMAAMRVKWDFITWQCDL